MSSGALILLVTSLLGTAPQGDNTILNAEQFFSELHREGAVWSGSLNIGDSELEVEELVIKKEMFCRHCGIPGLRLQFKFAGGQRIPQPEHPEQSLSVGQYRVPVRVHKLAISPESIFLTSKYDGPWAEAKGSYTALLSNVYLRQVSDNGVVTYSTTIHYVVGSRSAAKCSVTLTLTADGAEGKISGKKVPPVSFVLTRVTTATNSAPGS
jgi:hypothetical protein